MRDCKQLIFDILQGLQKNQGLQKIHKLQKIEELRNLSNKKWMVRITTKN